MEILAKYKKKSLEGFKEAVKAFETTSAAHLKNKLENAMLEDPVYCNYLLKNMLNLHCFMELTSDEIMSVCKNLQGYQDIIAQAIYKTPYAQELEKYLPKHILKEVSDALELVKDLRQATQESAVFSIVRTMRMLQENDMVEVRPWSMPPVEVVKENKTLPREGNIKLYYEDGTIALEGLHVKGKRHGIWKHHYPNGQVMAEGDYEIGVKTGLWSFWFSNGQLKSQGNYEEGIKQGGWKVWDRNNSESDVTYRNGKLAS